MRSSGRIAIVGTGFVADLYMRSKMTFPQIQVVAAFDIDNERLTTFCRYWKIRAAESLEEILADGPQSAELILNLTNPAAHFEVSYACLSAGKHVYSEKPLATDLVDARRLCALAESKSLRLASAPCNFLSEAAQTAWLAVRERTIGKPLLVYAELDDDFVSKAPYLKWFSESGAPWPYRDEFSIGCTLEHAGYYLAWLMAMFGSVEKVVAASAQLVAHKVGDNLHPAPDFSCATLFFRCGVVARLTCSIIAPHNHALRIIGDTGVLEVDQCWDNQAAVRIRRRFVLRRRLMNSPLARQFKIKGTTHPKTARKGAATMNFALGPAEVLASIREERPSRIPAGLALHLNEVTLAIQSGAGLTMMETICPPIEPMPWATIS